MGKLVRDRIPEIMRAAGKKPDVRILGEAAYVHSLFDKLEEETGELRAAEPNRRLEEAADVFEVLRAIASVNGFTIEDIETTADEKRAKRGGFCERIWLERW